MASIMVALGWMVLGTAPSFAQGVPGAVPVNAAPVNASPAAPAVPRETATATLSDGTATQQTRAAPLQTGRASYQIQAQDAPLARIRLELGYARWVNRREVPNTFYTVKAPMMVDLYDDWVMLRTDGGSVHLIPREYLVYVGSWTLDE